MKKDQDNSFPQYVQTDSHVYRKDGEGRIHRYNKMDYQSRPGYIRLKWLEKPYLWWKFKPFDFKNAIVPLFLGFSFAFIIFQLSMHFTQKEVEMEIMARMPKEYNKKGIEEYKKRKEMERREINQQAQQPADKVAPSRQI